MFYFLRKLPVPPFKKLTRLPLFEIKNFLTFHNRIFTKILLSSPILENEMQMSWHCQISWLSSN